MPSTLLPGDPRRQPDAARAAEWFVTMPARALLASEAGVLHDAARERPGQAVLWLGATAADTAPGPRLLRMHAGACGLQGDVVGGLPLPIASECCGVVVVQHLADVWPEPAALLEECARVLVPGGRLWLFGLNPLSPYRIRWQARGPRAAEPVTWRRRLRAAGLAPDAVSQGAGPTWSTVPDGALQDGVGLRAVFLLRAEKRRVPLTPRPAAAGLRWCPGPAA